MTEEVFSWKDDVSDKGGEVESREKCEISLR